MDVGRVFASSDEFIKAVHHFGASINTVFVKGDSKKTKGSRKDTYDYLTFTCKYGGKIRETSSTGRRQFSSRKCGCPVRLRVKGNSKDESMELSIVNLAHNHEVSEDLYKALPENRRANLTSSVLTMLTCPSVPNKYLRDYINAEQDKRLTKGDVQNLRKRYEKSLETGSKLTAKEEEHCYNKQASDNGDDASTAVPERPRKEMTMEAKFFQASMVLNRIQSFLALLHQDAFDVHLNALTSLLSFWDEGRDVCIVESSMLRMAGEEGYVVEDVVVAEDEPAVAFGVEGIAESTGQEVAEPLGVGQEVEVRIAGSNVGANNSPGKSKPAKSRISPGPKLTGEKVVSSNNSETSTSWQVVAKPSPTVRIILDTSETKAPVKKRRKMSVPMFRVSSS